MSAALVTLWSCLRLLWRSNWGITDWLQVWHPLPKTSVCDCEIPGFPGNGWRRCSAKVPLRPQGWGEGRWYHQIRSMKKHHCICRKALFQPSGILMVSLIFFPHFQKKVWRGRKKEEKRAVILKQTTGRQLHSISCGMLFPSQGLFRCTNWAEVGNGHESKPVFPSLHLA